MSSGFLCRWWRGGFRFHAVGRAWHVDPDEQAARAGNVRLEVARQFGERGLDGLYDEPRSGAPRKIGEAEMAEIVTGTLEETPSGATHWSLCLMARAMGHAPSRSTGSGEPSACGHSARRPSSCRRTRCSSTSCARSWVFISTRRSARWCCASTKRARSRRWNAPSRCCRRGPGRSSASPRPPGKMINYPRFWMITDKAQDPLG